ncbi:unnamed protein product [Rotaria sp. Silwood2]|nr:unnamed protein product [Rotaria sp. Silwood2]CAF3049288.1 unnamed protein product [Rotaria sp. Silwood2]CAF4419307.1 unnamed protein product [Rotaria sp. Silwood2]CAF4613970.1 unnamed protein product [Rotaria sp. Silwood2]
MNWFPLFIETVIHISQSDLIKKYLLCKCELDCINNELEQKSMEDFRQYYKAIEVISWHTPDIHHQLEKLHLNYINLLPIEQKQWTLYCEQGVSSEEMNKTRINVNSLI